MDVFTLGEIAEILQAPISRIKNWTAGRPFKIIPRIMGAKGKGSRNLYSLEDVYLFALVNQLHNDGLSNRVIPVLLEEVFLTPKLGPVSWFRLTRVGDKWQAKFSTGELRWEDIPGRRVKAKASVSHGIYLLDVRALVGWVNSRVAKLRGRS
jgi:hypothetical protein